MAEEYKVDPKKEVRQQNKTLSKRVRVNRQHQRKKKRKGMKNISIRDNRVKINGLELNRDQTLKC